MVKSPQHALLLSTPAAENQTWDRHPKREVDGNIVYAEQTLKAAPKMGTLFNCRCCRAERGCVHDSLLTACHDGQLPGQYLVPEGLGFCSPRGYGQRSFSSSRYPWPMPSSSLHHVFISTAGKKHQSRQSCRCTSVAEQGWVPLSLLHGVAGVAGMSSSFLQLPIHAATEAVMKGGVRIGVTAEKLWV